MINKESVSNEKRVLQETDKHVSDLQTIADATRDQIAFIDVDMQYIAVNHAYASFHHKQPEAFKGIAVEAIVGKVNFSHISPLIQKALNGNTFAIDGTYTLPNGNLVSEEARFNPIKDNKGVIIGCVAVIQDITEKLLAEKALKENEKLEKSLRQQYDLFRIVNDENPDIILMRDYDGKFLYANAALANLYATTPEELIGKTDKSFNPNKEQRDFFLQNIRDIMDKFETSIVEETSTDATTGEIHYFQSIKKPLKDENGNLRILVIAHDITDIKRNEHQLRQFAAVTQNSGEGVMILDIKQRIVAVNHAFTNITGYSEAEALDQKTSLLRSNKQDDTFYKDMWQAINEEGKWSGEIWNRNKNGEIYPEWLTISTIKDDSNKIVNYVGIFSDLSNLKASEEKIRYLALYDALTGLVNRFQFENRLKQTLINKARNGGNAAVFFLDLDNFKNINDTYGHETGDHILKTVSEELQLLLRTNDTLARFGGDEFVILCEDLSSAQDAVSVAQKLLHRFNTPFHTAYQTFHLACSIGITLYPQDGEDKTSLLKAADAAMYKAKESGKRNFAFYEPSLTKVLTSRLQMEDELRIALMQEQFELLYQPQVDLKNGKLTGFEVLLRWRHPDKGLLNAGSFISIIEQNHKIIPLGEWILNTACHQASSWYKEGIFDGKIAVNISMVQLEQSNVPQAVERALTFSGLSPNQLVIEITESVMMKAPERWIKLFSGLKKEGVRFAIDDFGTGYSSLAYLRQLPLDILKIDKSFVEDLPDDADACAIADTVISLASKLGLTTLAEGVETAEEAAYLIAAGCDVAQGYLYDKALTKTEARERLLHASYNAKNGEKTPHSCQKESI